MTRSILFGPNFQNCIPTSRRKQIDAEKLNRKVAQMIALLTCEKKSSNRKNIKYEITPELKNIINRMVRNLYANLPLNAMLVICTGHGDTAIVQRTFEVAVCVSIYLSIDQHIHTLDTWERQFRCLGSQSWCLQRQPNSA